MTEAALSTPTECVARAIQFKDDAKQLKAIGNQWFAVAYFYGAYLVVRAALMDDPVFRDLGRLKKYNDDFVPDDRFTSRHGGRISGNTRSYGVNDLVHALYGTIEVEYAQLYSASIAVRYGMGLATYDADALVADYDAIIDAYKAGALKAE